MKTSDWLSAAALAISLLAFARTWLLDWKRSRRADVTAYFRWLPALTYLDGREVGYHLVIQNRGPARAHNVALSAYAPRARESLGLSAVEIGDDPEFPIRVLDAGVDYPIPWLLDGVKKETRRRYRIELAWTERGVVRTKRRTRLLILRRGNVERIS